MTSVPLASKSAKLYRQVAHEVGWSPRPHDIIYRVPIHLAQSDEQAFDELTPTVFAFATSKQAPGRR